MEEEKLVSFDLKANFGFLKKPDYNDGLLLSYNMLHKPALLGILGAILGLSGYQQKGIFPEYYEKLKDLPIGIEPLNHEKGNFQKTSVKYSNTVGYANSDGNLLIEETMLIHPAYRCYLLLSMSNSDHAKLYDYLKEGKAEYIPYMGKNEFQIWWIDESTGENTFQEYNFNSGSSSNTTLPILTFFRKTINVRENTEDDSMANYNPFEFVFSPETFMYFERLPIRFDAELRQYKLEDYAYSNMHLKAGVQLPHIYYLSSKEAYVQLI
ncbi:CRISPR-associated protein Cas5 [Xanthocytophaga flava]|uniref:CRISPR-associated protein Cas5 n=1 Tax=Xanthocytophaga flava TaxID=3048013 RepID=UPI0028D52A23|nr:CRISPR-associated protein Cas5 [Xanthocytophaga flavus]MDJ1473780.1 CRISPR-associated protein Cas5 [Xanthocytophaga flavus]